MDLSIYLRDLRVFLILWFSQSLSQIGSAMTALALVIYAYRETGSATAVTLLTASAAIPYTLVSFFAGPLVDRLPKKALMLTADSAAACCTGSRSCCCMRRTGSKFRFCTASISESGWPTRSSVRLRMLP